MKFLMKCSQMRENLVNQRGFAFHWLDRVFIIICSLSQLFYLRDAAKTTQLCREVFCTPCLIKWSLCSSFSQWPGWLLNPSLVGCARRSSKAHRTLPGPFHFPLFYGLWPSSLPGRNCVQVITAAVGLWIQQSAFLNKIKREECFESHKNSSFLIFLSN